MSIRKLSVCFVCLGNICRSPTAEGVFAKLVADANLRGVVRVDSAGLGAWHKGERADKRARTVAEKSGYELNSVARQLLDTDFDNFDLLIAMDKSNVTELQARAPNAAGKVKIKLLRDFDASSPKGAEVPDPYYGRPEDFRLMFNLVEAACKGLFEYVVDRYRLEPPS